MTSRSDSLLEALSTRVVVADGAMGTMLQAADPSLEDMEGLEGCNEVLNVTRPDIVRSVHDAYLEAGADLVETNTFGANVGNLGEYDISHRVHELAEAGAPVFGRDARIDEPDLVRLLEDVHRELGVAIALGGDGRDLLAREATRGLDQGLMLFRKREIHGYYSFMRRRCRSSSARTVRVPSRYPKITPTNIASGM